MIPIKKKNYKEIFPVVACYGFRKNTRAMRFYKGPDIIEIKENNALIENILKTCDGYHSLKDIENFVDDNEFSKVVNILFEREILLDSNRLYKSFINISANPLHYPARFLSASKIEAHKNTTIKIKPLKNTNLKKILNHRKSTRFFTGKHITVNQI